MSGSAAGAAAAAGADTNQMSFGGFLLSEAVSGVKSAAGILTAEQEADAKGAPCAPWCQPACTPLPSSLVPPGYAVLCVHADSATRCSATRNRPRVLSASRGALLSPCAVQLWQRQNRKKWSRRTPS